MKRFYYLYILFSFGCQSGSNTSIDSEKACVQLTYDPQLIISRDDSLVLKSSGFKNIYSRIFDSSNAFCKMENDTLKIFMTNWFGPFTVNLMVTGDTVVSTHKLIGNYAKFKYGLPQIKMKFNKHSFKEGDYIIYGLNYRVLGISEENSSIKDTLTINGKLKLRIQDSKFSFQELFVQNQRNEFYTLLLGAPDTISRLNLYGCDFKTLPPELSRFTTLEELNLEGNDLGHASFDVLNGLKELKNLNLGHCNLTGFPRQVLVLSNLEVLSIYGNNISEIPDELYELTSLKELNIGGNSLWTLSPGISKLVNLVSLETSATEIRRYPEAMTNLKKLNEIYPSDTMHYIPKPLVKYVWGCDTILSK